MTETKTTKLTVMFADICRSTFLFTQLGDQKALQLVTEVLDLANQIARAHGGTVIGTIGDEILTTFTVPQHALEAANAIQSEVRSQSNFISHGLAVSIGINYGPVVVTNNNIHGDTVNIGARLAQQAKPNQTLVSSSAVMALDNRTHLYLRSIGPLSLQGKAGTTDVHELLTTDRTDEITDAQQIAAIQERAFLVSMSYHTKRMRFDPLLVRFLFGRSQRCDQVIDHSSISREHAELRYINGKFVFRDFSTNGSAVIIEQKVEHLFRTSIELRGEGEIYLGRTLNDRQFCIEFKCTTER